VAVKLDVVQEGNLGLIRGGGSAHAPIRFTYLCRRGNLVASTSILGANRSALSAYTKLTQTRKRCFSHQTWALRARRLAELVSQTPMTDVLAMPCHTGGHHLEHLLTNRVREALRPGYFACNL
jgi:hypothetical protein